MSRPAGSIILTHPTRGLGGFVGRTIAKRIGVPFSHTAVALGNGWVAESTWKWIKLTREETWVGKGIWFMPPFRLSEERQRVGRSIAYFTQGRIKYSLKAGLFDFLLRGVPGGRGHGLFCSYFVAEWYMTVADVDISGVKKPWLVTPADVLSYVETQGWTAEPS